MNQQSASNGPVGSATLPGEGGCFGRYVLGRVPDPVAIELYERAIQMRPDRPGPDDERLLRLVLKHPAWLGCIDGALALTRPRSALRQRLLVMTAILESRPAHAALFLPGGGSVVRAMFHGLRAMLRAAGGLILLRLV